MTEWKCNEKMKERDEKKRMSIIIISFGQFFRQYPCTKSNGLKLYRTLAATLHFSLFTFQRQQCYL